MKKKQLIITGAAVVVLALAFGVYAMTNNSDQDKETKESSFTNPISEQKPVDETVVEDPETVPVPNPGNTGGGSGDPQTPQVVNPSATASQTFHGGMGTITASINAGTAALDAVIAYVDGVEIGSQSISSSGNVQFTYHSANGTPFNSVSLTIYDKSGKTYQSTHQL